MCKTNERETLGFCQEGTGKRERRDPSVPPLSFSADDTRPQTQLQLNPESAAPAQPEAPETAELVVAKADTILLAGLPQAGQGISSAGLRWIFSMLVPHSEQRYSNIGIGASLLKWG